MSVAFPFSHSTACFALSAPTAVPEPPSAARFTRSGVLAAPVLLCTERCELGMLRAVVANSGNANAATGRPGF